MSTMTKLTTLVTGLAMAAGLVLSVPANAEATASVPARVQNQNARITRGVRSGRLSRRQARRLRAADRRIGRSARRARMNGRMTHRRHRMLEHRLNRNSERINNQMH